MSGENPGVAGVKPCVLVVDDDAAVGKVLDGILRQEGFDSSWVPSATEALELLNQRFVGLVITDLRMPEIDGMALMGRVKQVWPEVPVVMMTAFGTVPLAVEAMRNGAADFIQKPFDRKELVSVVNKALLRAVNDTRPATNPRPASTAQPGPASSGAMHKCDDAITKAAKSMATVLLLGENGVGKELAAHAIHDRSSRKDRPFVVMQATALPENLFYSELFGHEKGVFTDAHARKPGRVELAEGGTLFLDEFADISAEAQLTLLRLIQEKEYTRIGGKPIKADVRFVCATNRDLAAMVARKEFREDLYHRINVIPIRIPALRERREDIRPLAVQFCREHGAANAQPDASLTDEALAVLETQPWPGNVRQLQNFVERLVVMSDTPRIDAAYVERELKGSDLAVGTALPTAGADASLGASRAEAEGIAIRNALDRANGNCTVCARILGVSRRTLYNKLTELGIDPRQSRSRRG